MATRLWRRRRIATLRQPAQRAAMSSTAVGSPDTGADEQQRQRSGSHSRPAATQSHAPAVRQPWRSGSRFGAQRQPGKRARQSGPQAQYFSQNAAPRATHEHASVSQGPSWLQGMNVCGVSLRLAKPLEPRASFWRRNRAAWAVAQRECAGIFFALRLPSVSDRPFDPVWYRLRFAPFFGDGDPVSSWGSGAAATSSATSSAAPSKTPGGAKPSADAALAPAPSAARAFAASSRSAASTSKAGGGGMARSRAS
mmetsp:Transcript_25210/g.86350  ORF Transcript_25210/g.86350 Transcript_25210/m.86350 type:complete len:253 (+) Transcript_25210:389-1147(+)